MSCDWATQHLDEYELGALDAAERERLEGHLAACEACRKRLAEIRSADEAVRSALAWAEPDPSFARRVAGQACRPRRRRWLAAVVAAAAAVALCVVFLRGSGGSRVRTVEQLPGTPAPPAERVFAGMLRDAYGLPVRRIESGRPYVACGGAALNLDRRSLFLLAGGTEFASEADRGQRQPAISILSGAVVGHVADGRRELAVELAPELGGAIVRTNGCEFYSTGFPAHRLAQGGVPAGWPEVIRVHVFEGRLELYVGPQKLVLSGGDSAIIWGGVSAGSTRMVEARIDRLRLALGEDVLARCRQYRRLADQYARRLLELRAATGRGAPPYLSERVALVDGLLCAHAEALERLEAERPEVLELDAAEAELDRLDWLRQEANQALDGLVTTVCSAR